MKMVPMHPNVIPRVRFSTTDMPFHFLHAFHLQNVQKTVVPDLELDYEVTVRSTQLVQIVKDDEPYVIRKNLQDGGVGSTVDFRSGVLTHPDARRGY